MRCFQITISGETYGKGLRFSSMHIAHTLSIRGYVQYTRAGNIFIEAEGDDEHIDQFLAWCRNEATSPQVSSISIVEAAPKGHSSFDIRHGTCNDDAPSLKPFPIKPLRLFFGKIRRVIGLEKKAVSEEIR